MVKEKVLASETYELDELDDVEASENVRTAFSLLKTARRVDQLVSRFVWAIYAGAMVFVATCLIFDVEITDGVQNGLLIGGALLFILRGAVYLTLLSHTIALVKAQAEFQETPDSEIEAIIEYIDSQERDIERLELLHVDLANRIAAQEAKFAALEEQLSSIDTQEADKADERWDSLVQSVENLVHAEVLRQGTADHRKAAAELAERVATEKGIDDFLADPSAGVKLERQRKSEGNKKPGGSTT